MTLKAKFESGSSYYSFKGLVSGAFKMCLIGSTCTALPGKAPVRSAMNVQRVSSWKRAPNATPRQGLTLVHFSAQLERFVWDRECA